MALRSFPDGRARFYSRHEFSAGDAFEVLVENLVAGLLIEIEPLEKPLPMPRCRQVLARIYGGLILRCSIRVDIAYCPCTKIKA